MSNAVHFDLHSDGHLREFANQHQSSLVASLFALLFAAQAIGFLMLGTERKGLTVALTLRWR